MSAFSVHGMMLPAVLPCKQAGVVDPIWYEIQRGEVPGVTGTGNGTYYYRGFGQPGSAWRYIGFSTLNFSGSVDIVSPMAGGGVSVPFDCEVTLGAPGSAFAAAPPKHSVWASLSAQTVDPFYANGTTLPGLISSGSINVFGLSETGNVGTRGNSVVGQRSLFLPGLRTFDWAHPVQNDDLTNHDGSDIPLFSIDNHGPSDAPYDTPVPTPVFARVYVVSMANLCAPIKFQGVACAIAYFGLVVALTMEIPSDGLLDYQFTGAGGGDGPLVYVPGGNFYLISGVTCDTLGTHNLSSGHIGFTGEGEGFPIGDNLVVGTGSDDPSVFFGGMDGTGSVGHPVGSNTWTVAGEYSDPILYAPGTAL